MSIREANGRGVKFQIKRKRRSYHAGKTPDVSAGTPRATADDLGRPVLAGLDIVCEMTVDPTGVPQVGNLDGELEVGGRVRDLLLLVQRYVGNVLG